MTTTLTTLRETGRPVLVRPAEVPPVRPRLVALAVDQLLVVVCCLATTAVWLAFGGTGRSLLVVWLLTGLVVETGQAFAEAVSGATLGGALTHVRTVSARTGWPAGLVAVVVRRLVLTAAGVLLPVVGAYVVAGSGAWDHSPARRGWHDWAADTLVLCDWAVPDQDERAAERAGRKAAQQSGTSGADGPSDTTTSADVDDAVEPEGRTATTSADVDDEKEPLDHRTATTVDVRPASTTSEPEAGREPTEGPTLGLTSVVPIVVPDLRPEPEPELSRARHRATTLGLGRPRPYASLGRHRVPEVPTQRTSPRFSSGWPRPGDDLELPRARLDDNRDNGYDGLRLVFDCGVCVEVTGSGAVGRDLTGVIPPPVHPVVVDDPKRTVSRVHLRFGLHPGRAALWVMDENSTNGTILVRPDGGARVLPAGVPAVVGAGWQIRFGERSAVVEGPALSTAPSTDPVERVSRLDQGPVASQSLGSVLQLSDASKVAAE